MERGCFKAREAAISARVDKINERPAELKKELGLGSGKVDQQEARSVAAEEYRLSKNSKKFDDAAQDKHADRVMKMYGASD